MSQLGRNALGTARSHDLVNADPSIPESREGMSLPDAARRLVT